MLQIFIGIILTALAPIWIFIITPEFLKLPANISTTASLIHSENNRFDIGSDWTGKTIAISTSTIKTFVTMANQSTLQSLFRVESLTGETLFELDQSFIVDRQTRHDLPGGNDTEGKSSILFAPNLSHDAIYFWPVEMGSPSLLKYIDNKKVQGVNTFHFGTSGSIIDDTLGYGFLPLVPEKYRVLSKINVDVYVEPQTGMIIDYQDSGTSFYADNTNKDIWDIAQWSNKYNDPTIIERAKQANSLGQSYFLASKVAPAALLIFGLLLLLTGIFYKNTKKEPSR